MLKYEDVVNSENEFLVFSCKMKDGPEKQLQIHDDCSNPVKPNFVFYNFESSISSKLYTGKDIDEIIGQVHFYPEGLDGLDSLD